MAKKYRLLLTASEFMYSSQVRNLCDLVTGLDRNLFDIEIGALELGNEASVEIERLGVPWYQLRTLPSRQLPLERTWGFLKSPSILRQKHFDLVHSLLWQSQYFEPLIVRLFSRAKYVYTKSNLQWDNHRINWHWKSKLSHKIVSISGATDDLLKSKGFGDKSVKIYLGIDTDKFKRSDQSRMLIREQNKIPPDAVVFGCAAQFIEVKDHPTLITAFENLSRRYPNLYLLLCGPHHDDDYYRRVMKQISASPYSSRIIYLGTLSDMPAFYSAIDCFVLPSYWEAMGYVLVEAMSCELPVVACRIFGPLDMIESERNGYLFNPKDSEDLARKLEVYCSNSDVAQQQSQASRQRAITIFSKDAMAKQTQSLYLDLFGTSSGRKSG